MDKNLQFSPASSVLQTKSAQKNPVNTSKYPSTKTQITSEVPKRPVRKSLPKSRTSCQSSQRESICSNMASIPLNGAHFEGENLSAALQQTADKSAAADQQTADLKRQQTADSTADKSSDDTLTDVKATLEENKSAETLVEVKLNAASNFPNENATEENAIEMKEMNEKDDNHPEKDDNHPEKDDKKEDEEENQAKWSRSKSYVHAIDT